jgi:hypothetical protein
MVCCEYINWVTSNRQATSVIFFIGSFFTSIKREKKIN